MGLIQYYLNTCKPINQAIRIFENIENIENIYCHSLSIQYNTFQCYLSTECIQNQFLFLLLC